MSRDILKSIIDNFNVNKFVKFFREKNNSFVPRKEDLSYYNNDDFQKGIKIGEIDFKKEGQNLIVCSFFVKKELSEKSGKKVQYELAKKILKEMQIDAGIFIFYDKAGNFRFSLIYANYLGKRRDWSAFRRFTYFVSKELTNKTFLQRIGDGDFSTLGKIKEAFSVEKVTKEFYKDIANWYFWAVKHSQFPKDAEIEDNGRNVAVIRLITRMIFIWFMRERGLVTKDLFDEKNIEQILKSTNPDTSTYYQAILQNLFFATLSTKREERQLRDERRFNKGWNKDFGNQYVYRYHELFIDSDKIKSYFNEIPFLNGGLFECLDDKDNGIYVDGFTATKKHQPQVPNFLFFSGEKKADLNAYYGTKGKNYKVHGLCNILSSFNFTIDENSPDDADIALDPELLGRVFENLLASFNPETSTTARKATGSYYTPREIVDYMVTESLKEYFKTHLPEIKNLDKKFETLFSTGNTENPFSKSESKKLVELIESVRIIDPAVGSGAFPMGALNKMVFILNKVDPENKFWEQVQLNAAESIPDPQVRRNTKEQIEEFFKDKNADYGRKLYLIQKCIYGVDIQQIAVEIAKLRFFISLLVDEKIDESKENWGIEPLPNLDFKIMQGNSLISKFLGVDFDNGQAKQEQAGMLFTEKEDNLIKEFEQKKIDFQNEPDKNKKIKLKNEVEDLMIKIFETKIKKQKTDYFRQMENIEKKYSTLPNKKTREEMIVKEKQKLSKKTGFDLTNIEKQLREFTSKNKTKPFFAWKLYFAEVFEKGGFDIAIANPPYIDYRKINKDTKNALSKFYSYRKLKTGNIFIYFIELGINLLNEDGIATYINPYQYLTADFAAGLREFLIQNSSIMRIVNVSNIKVFKASVYTSINFFKKIKIKQNQIEIIQCRQLEDLEEVGYKVSQDSISANNQYLISVNPYTNLLDKLEDSAKRLGSLCRIFCGTSSRGFSKLIINTHQYNQLSGKEQNNYCIIKQSSDIKRYYVNSEISYIHKKIYSSKVLQNFLRPKIFFARMTKWIRCFYTEKNYCAGKVNVLVDFQESSQYLLALLNSKLLNFWYSNRFESKHLSGGYLSFDIPSLKFIPIKITSKNNQQKVINLVNKILAITKDDDYLENTAKQARVRKYEKQIDQLVYKLYGLTKEEIKIVENFKM